MKPDYKNWMPKGMVYGFMMGGLLITMKRRIKHET